jgi:glycerol-3-phosphate dehydrogenase
MFFIVVLALKEFTVLPSGYCDALELGSSTKAAVIRRGLQETMDFCRLIAEDDFKVKKKYLICLMLPCHGMAWDGMGNYGV